jgi:uncharacterized membrane protein (UPF0127 family)
MVKIGSAGLVLVVAAVLGACGGDDRSVATIDTEEGQVRVDVELAETAEERRQGLSGRETLAADAGMLFLYSDEHRGGFWMKDTLIPLSIAFLDDGGAVLAILDMEPCTGDPCPTYDPGVGYWSALEVNRGAFSEWGVEPGDVVVLDR